VATASSLHRGIKFSALSNSVRTKRLTRESLLWIVVPRGGSTEEESDEDDHDHESDDEDESEEEDEGERDEEENEEAQESPLSSVISSKPATVTIKTNLGNPLIDQSVELLVSRTRNVESVKQTLSRQLPGRPPVSALTLMSGTRVLGDDELIDELVDDEEEDEDDDDDDEEATSLVLTLDMVPPVDPKFATNFGKLNEMTTSEILDAYAANAAAMYHNAQSLVSEPAGDKAFGSLNIQLRHEAYRIRNQLTSTFPESALEKLEETSPPHSSVALDQRRGQRYRSGRGGARTNIKRRIQRNLNVVRTCGMYPKHFASHVRHPSTHLVSPLAPLLELARHHSQLFTIYLFWPFWREKHCFQESLATGSTALLCVAGSTCQDNVEASLLFHGSSTRNLVEFAPGPSAGDSQLSRK
jgi:hypothetical protein